MPDNDETTYAHLVTFLQSEREDVLESATEAALTVATNRDWRIRHNLVKYSIIPPLTRLINRPRRIGYLSLATLLHLTSTTNDDEKTMVVFKTTTTTTTTNNNKNTTASTARAASDEILSSRGLERAVEVGLSYSSFRHDDGDDEDTKRQHVNHAMSLMVNLTIDEKGAGRLLSSSGDAIGEKEAFEKLELLVGRYMDGTYRRRGGNDKDDELAATAAAAGGGAFSLLDDDETIDDDDEVVEGEKGGVYDPYQHVSSILRNVTQIEVGRRFVLSSKMTVGGGILPPLLKSVLKELRSSSNPVRRRGCAGTIKNCCFEPERARLWVLPLVNDENNVYGEDDDIVFSLLFPLAGPEEISCDDERLMIGDVLLSRMGPEKIRERDGETRLLIVETILLLCAAGRRVREILRARGTYVVLKNADMVEEREDVSEKIEECVQFLKRDEEGTKEGSSDEMALELAQKMQRKTTIKEMEDYDDVD